MNKMNCWLAGCLLTGMILAAVPARATEDEVILCPGSGERCAQVKFLFIKYWKMKEKGGPGIIIIEDES